MLATLNIYPLAKLHLFVKILCVFNLNNLKQALVVIL